MNPLVLVTVALIAGGSSLLLGTGALHRYRRRNCPACSTKQLASTGGKLVPGGGYVTSFRCLGCGAEFRQFMQQGLVPLEAWERGMREPPPTATTIKR